MSAQNSIDDPGPREERVLQTIAHAHYAAGFKDGVIRTALTIILIAVLCGCGAAALLIWASP